MMWAEYSRRRHPYRRKWVVIINCVGDYCHDRRCAYALSRLERIYGGASTSMENRPRSDGMITPAAPSALPPATPTQQSFQMLPTRRRPHLDIHLRQPPQSEALQPMRLLRLLEQRLQSHLPLPKCSSTTFRLSRIWAMCARAGAGGSGRHCRSREARGEPCGTVWLTCPGYRLHPVHDCIWPLVTSTLVHRVYQGGRTEL